MPEEPFLFRLLRKLGIRTTKLRWILFKWEQRAQRLRNTRKLPQRMRWMRYGHKICRHCGSLNDRGARECYRCERSLPSMAVYKMGRAFGFMMPESSPRVVMLYMAACIVLFCVQLGLDGPRAFLAPTEESLDLLGAFAYAPGYVELAWQRMLTFGLVHFGILHIGFNCYAMSILGGLCETQLGHKRVVVLITLAQLGAAAASWYWYVQVRGGPVYTAGASGWVSGLLGFAIVYFYKMGRAGEMYRRQLVQWAIYILAFGIFLRANNAGHIGGFLAGAALGFFSEGRVRKYHGALWEAAFWASVALWVLALGTQALYAIQHFGDVMNS